MQRIIVTGATGCVGTAVVRRALESGMSVLCIVHRGSMRIKNLPKSENLQVVECDLQDYRTLVLNNKCDAFIHLAWEKTFVASRDDVEVQMRNIQFTLDAVHLAKRCGCSVFVGIGSQAEYGIQNANLTPSMAVQPESGYGIAKYAAGKLSAMLCKCLGMRQCWVRILSVYGPNDSENTLVSYVIREFKAGRPPQLTRCEQLWDYLYADDAADAILAVVEKGEDGKAYPLGSGQGRRLSEFVEDIREVVNPSIDAVFGIREYYPHQPMHLVAEVDELMKDTGWKPNSVFKERIREML